jgi:hypothetical protein
VAYFAKNAVSHGLADGNTKVYEVGDRLDEADFSQADLDTLLANDAIEQHDGDEWSGDRPVGPLERQPAEASGTVDEVNLPEAQSEGDEEAKLPPADPNDDPDVNPDAKTEE